MASGKVAPADGSVVGDSSEGGGEPCSDATAVPAPTEPWTIEERLTKFYEKYVPEKVADVAKLLEKYKGKEEKVRAGVVGGWWVGGLGEGGVEGLNDIHDADESDKSDRLPSRHLPLT